MKRLFVSLFFSISLVSHYLAIEWQGRGINRGLYNGT